MVELSRCLPFLLGLGNENAVTVGTLIMIYEYGIGWLSRRRALPYLLPLPWAFSARFAGAQRAHTASLLLSYSLRYAPAFHSLPSLYNMSEFYLFVYAVSYLFHIFYLPAGAKRNLKFMHDGGDFCFLILSFLVHQICFLPGLVHIAAKQNVQNNFIVSTTFSRTHSTYYFEAR